MAQYYEVGMNTTKALLDPSNVSLAGGINMSVVGCLVSFLVLCSPTFCLYPLEPLFLTSVCYQLWQLGIESAFAFIQFGLCDRTLWVVGELPFPCCVVLF